MMRTTVAMVVVVALGVASAAMSGPVQPRAVPNPTTPNQILDKVAEDAVTIMQGKGWCVSRNIPNQDIFVGVAAETDGASNTQNNTVGISSGGVEGMCSLTRSASGSFNTDQSVLTGTLRVDLIITSSYQENYPGDNAAPQIQTAGSNEFQARIFADVELNMVGTQPQSIKSYSTRFGETEFVSHTGIDTGDIGEVEEESLKISDENAVMRVMQNIKVAINQGIQAAKA